MSIIIIIVKWEKSRLSTPHDTLRDILRRVARPVPELLPNLPRLEQVRQGHDVVLRQQKSLHLA